MLSWKATFCMTVLEHTSRNSPCCCSHDPSPQSAMVCPSLLPSIVKSLIVIPDRESALKMRAHLFCLGASFNVVAPRPLPRSMTLSGRFKHQALRPSLATKYVPRGKYTSPP